MINICWKFQWDIWNSFGLFEDLLKNLGEQWPTFRQFLLKKADWLNVKLISLCCYCSPEFYNKSFIIQNSFENSYWNFQQMLITWLSYIDKKIGHISISKTGAPSKMPKLWTTVAAIVFEIFSKNKNSRSYLDLSESPNSRTAPVWTHKLLKNSETPFFFKIFKIPSNQQLV